MNDNKNMPIEPNVHTSLNQEITNQEIANEENVNEENVNKESKGLKVGLGVAAVAATGAVVASSFRKNEEEVVSNDPSVENIANVNPNENLPGETFTDESVINSHGNSLGSTVSETSPSDIYVHTVDEYGNESVTHYQDYNNDGEMDQYEVYDSEGNLVDQGAVVNTISESDVNSPGSDESDISFYPENDIYDEDQGSIENDPNVMVDHDNQPDQGEYEGIDWEAVENGSMDEIVVNDATGADSDDILASNDQNPSYDNNSISFNENVADNSNEYILDENEISSVEDYDLNANWSATDDYASNDNSVENFNSVDYNSDEFGSEDYGSDDYNSGLEDFGC